MKFDEYIVQQKAIVIYIGVNNPFFIILLFFQDKIILTIVTTVSERRAPPSHANTHLTQRQMRRSELVIKLTKNILLALYHRTCKPDYFSVQLAFAKFLSKIKGNF